MIKRIINGQEIIIKLTKQEEESIYEKIAQERLSMAERQYGNSEFKTWD